LEKYVCKNFVNLSECLVYHILLLQSKSPQIYLPLVPKNPRTALRAPAIRLFSIIVLWSMWYIFLPVTTRLSSPPVVPYDKTVELVWSTRISHDNVFEDDTRVPDITLTRAYYVEHARIALYGQDGVELHNPVRRTRRHLVSFRRMIIKLIFVLKHGCEFMIWKVTNRHGVIEWQVILR
jgi:hypothetical protein